MRKLTQQEMASVLAGLAPADSRIALKWLKGERVRSSVAARLQAAREEWDALMAALDDKRRRENV